MDWSHIHLSPSHSCPHSIPADIHIHSYSADPESQCIHLSWCNCDVIHWCVKSDLCNDLHNSFPHSGMDWRHNHQYPPDSGLQSILPHTHTHILPPDPAHGTTSTPAWPIFQLLQLTSQVPPFSQGYGVQSSWLLSHKTPTYPIGHSHTNPNV